MQHTIEFIVTVAVGFITIAVGIVQVLMLYILQDLRARIGRLEEMHMDERAWREVTSRERK